MEITNSPSGQLDLLEASRFRVRALYVGERIETRSLERTEYLAISPLVLPVGEKGCAVLFRYGVIVLLNVSPLEEAALLAKLEPFIAHAFQDANGETAEIVIQPAASSRIEGGIIFLPRITMEQIQLVGEVLAKSTVLDHYETKMAASFEAIEPLVIHLQTRGREGIQTKSLVNHIGEVLINQQKMVGRVEVSEKPDVLWYHPDLERLYAQLQDEFEIRERHRALERKLQVISRTAQTLLDILQAKRTLRVEWYIVILILIEIVLTLYQLFLRG